MELSPSPAPLPRAYDDRAVLLLEPMRDWFYARGLKNPRFSKTQEEEWVAGVAKDIQRNELATAIVKRWLKAISLTERQELHHVVPPLTDETLQLFVRFFWLVNSDNRPRANDLLLDARREWGREKYFHEYAANRFLEFGEDPALWITVVTDWVHEQRSQGHGLNLRKTAKSLKSLKSVKRKMNVNTPFSTKATKRLAAAPPNFKRKRRLETKARPGQRTTVNKDAESSEVASGLGRITRGSKRKCGHNVSKLGKLQSKRHIKCSVVASSVPTFPVGATGRGFKRADVKTKNSARKQRLFARSSLSSSSTDRSQTPANTTAGEGNAGLNRDMAHIGASAYKFHVNGEEKDASLLFAFDNHGAEVAEDEDDLYGCAPNEYLGISSIELDQKQHIAVRPRPPLPVTPPIWAQSRQEVCESLDSFRSYQGGVYHANDIVKGYLLGGHSSGRDLFHHGGRLIISHGGGKSEAIHAKNRRLEIKGPTDQLEDDRSVRALLNNYRSGRPLVVIADNNYALFPFDLSANGYSYVVLGLYWIAHAWAELQLVDKDHSVVRYKFAFQWCEGQGDPWWLQGTEEVPDAQAPNGQPCDHEPGANTTEERDNSTSSCQPAQLEITTYSCRSCQLSSPVVYQDAPMCLQPRCAAFCRIDQSMLDSPSHVQTLSYSSELLRLRPANHLPVCADSLYPPSPAEGSTTPRPFAKGMHCKDCGRLSTRFKWEHYECSHCHRIYEAPSFVFSHKDFWLQEQSLKFYQHRVADDSGIVIRGLEFRPRANGSALPYVQTFDLPDNRGRVHLIPGHPSVNGEANALFHDYQGQAARGEIQFRRWPLRAHKCRGQLLSNYFSQNTGAPYKYVGGAERTTPLEEGAQAVLGALELIKHRIATVLGKDVPFNEVLSAAYMEKQKMAFHSDSERGLGPVVASLSLGSAAEMHFRLHSKYAVTDGPRKVAMSILLRHGDVLVMEGAGVQEYYEHTVIPKNFRIVATARFISPENYTTGGQSRSSADS